MRAWKTTKKT